MLTIQWQSPRNGDGAPVTYVVTVSPGSTEVNTTVTSASLSAVPYNVINTINIVATNCIGSSSVVMETIRISTLRYIHSNVIIIDSESKTVHLQIYTK